MLQSSYQGHRQLGSHVYALTSGFNDTTCCEEFLIYLYSRDGSIWRKAPDWRFTMLLRDHPLFRYHGMRSWPPVWLWMSGGYDRNPRGEVGILRKVEKSNVLPANRGFLYIDYEDASYIGCLLCSEQGFCNSIVKVLEANLNKTIAQIGSLDISRLL